MTNNCVTVPAITVVGELSSSSKEKWHQEMQGLIIPVAVEQRDPREFCDRLEGVFAVCGSCIPVHDNSFLFQVKKGKGGKVVKS